MDFVVPGPPLILKKLDDSKGVVTFGYDQNSKGNYPSSVNGMLIYRNSFFQPREASKTYSFNLKTHIRLSDMVKNSFY